MYTSQATTKMNLCQYLLGCGIDSLIYFVQENAANEALLRFSRLSNIQFFVHAAGLK
jgi:hypothetical protein